MDNLTKAIFAKKANSTFNTLIGGRLFEDVAPYGTPYPYAVYTIVSSPKEKTFTEIYRNTNIQFTLYSASKSSTELKAIYAALSALYDECSLTISGSALVWMREENVLFNIEAMATPKESEIVRVCYVDFDVKTSLN